MKVNKFAKISVWSTVLLTVDFVLGDEPYFCGFCDEIHDASNVCLRPLFGLSTEENIKYMDYLEYIQENMAKLDHVSRVVLILSLMYKYSPGPYPSKDLRWVIDPKSLFVFSWNLRRNIWSKYEALKLQKQTFERKNMYVYKFLEIFRNIEEDLYRIFYCPGCDVVSFYNDVVLKIQNITDITKMFLHKLIPIDVSCVELDSEEKNVLKYESLRVSIIQKLRTAFNVFFVSKKGKFLLDKGTDMSRLSAVKILKIVKARFLTSLKNQNRDFIACMDLAKKIELFLYPMDNIHAQKVLRLVLSSEDSEGPIVEIVDNIEYLLETTGKLAITEVIKDLMVRYTFSLYDIIPCSYMCHLLEREQEGALNLEEYFKKFKELSL